MSLVKVIRHGQITLPASVRKALQVADGDYLEADVADGVVTLRPVSVVGREASWRRIREAQEAVSYVGPEPRPSPDVEEEQIQEIVAEFRAKRA